MPSPWPPWWPLWRRPKRTGRGSEWPTPASWAMWPSPPCGSYGNHLVGWRCSCWAWCPSRSRESSSSWEWGSAWRRRKARTWSCAAAWTRAWPSCAGCDACPPSACGRQHWHCSQLCGFVWGGGGGHQGAHPVVSGHCSGQGGPGPHAVGTGQGGSSGASNQGLLCLACGTCSSIACSRSRRKHPR